MKGKDRPETDSRETAEDAGVLEQRAAVQIAKRIADGDRSAEQELVERYSRPLLFMLRRRCGDPELANDLHQDVFRIVIERLRGKSINDPTRLAGFIQSTGRNLLIGVIRRRQRRKTYADSDTIADASDNDAMDQVGEINAAQMAVHVKTLLDELGSDRDRAILNRFYLQQEDKQSICAGLDLSDLHFNRVLYRAKKRFKELLLRSETDIARDLIEGRGQE
ncbi:MAG: RNA polymerase sigma factor [Woeseiaceae bacterium]